MEQKCVVLLSIHVTIFCDGALARISLSRREEETTTELHGGHLERWPCERYKAGCCYIDIMAWPELTAATWWGPRALAVFEPGEAKGAKQLKCAETHIKASSVIPCISCITFLSVLLKVRAFLSNQIHQVTRTIMESKVFLSSLLTRLLAFIHQSAKVCSPDEGDSTCQVSRERYAYQIFFVKEQRSSRWLIVSCSYPHKQQVSSFWRLCLLRLAAVQQRPCSASQRKNLHLPGALAFQRILTPGIPCWPMKKARYALAVVK